MIEIAFLEGENEQTDWSEAVSAVVVRGLHISVAVCVCLWLDSNFDWWSSAIAIGNRMRLFEKGIDRCGEFWFREMWCCVMLFGVLLVLIDRIGNVWDGGLLYESLWKVLLNSVVLSFRGYWFQLFGVLWFSEMNINCDSWRFTQSLLRKVNCFSASINFIHCAHGFFFLFSEIRIVFGALIFVSELFN